MKKILVSNVTGSQKVVATLHTTSGVIEFPDGQLSHILFEKQMQKSVVEYHEPKPQEVKPEPAKEASPSLEQSKEGIKKKTKTK